MQNSQYYSLKTTLELKQLGADFSTQLRDGGLVYLIGNLGAGKTTLSQGIMHGLGFNGIVKSPTYTLVETYQLSYICVHHFDLYRLDGQNELEDLGFRDYFDKKNLILIEWPEKTRLPPADWTVQIDYVENGRTVKIIRA